MRRRDFLAIGLRSGLCSLLPLAACSREERSLNATNDLTPEKILITDLEKELPGMMADANLPGLSIALIKDAKLVWRRGFGVKDAASKQPIDNDTMFEAASMSKPVFAYIVMKLCEKGVMDLDTPLSRYTTERFLQGDPRLERITARHVLSHTSGFQNWRSEKEPLKIHFAPGEKYQYSGEGYSYLQSVVTRLTQQAFGPYMQANLLEPFGMTLSGYVWNDTCERHMARPHDAAGKPMNSKKGTEESVARYGSAGALLTTPTDYAKFLIEVIEPKGSDAVRLNSESVKEMLRPQIKNGDSSSWALGWAVQHTENGDFDYHGGDNDGFHAFAMVSVERKSGYVVMTNGDGGTKLLNALITRSAMNRFLTT